MTHNPNGTVTLTPEEFVWFQELMLRASFTCQYCQTKNVVSAVIIPVHRVFCYACGAMQMLQTITVEGE